MDAWEQLGETDIRTVKRTDLEDITQLERNGADGGNQDMQTFIRKMRNPYCFMVGDVIVKSTFVEGVSLEQRMQELAEGL